MEHIANTLYALLGKALFDIIQFAVAIIFYLLLFIKTKYDKITANWKIITAIILSLLTWFLALSTGLIEYFVSFSKSGGSTAVDSIGIVISAICIAGTNPAAIFCYYQRSNKNELSKSVGYGMFALYTILTIMYIYKYFAITNFVFGGVCFVISLVLSTVVFMLFGKRTKADSTSCDMARKEQTP